jgi:hypothetical protein
LIALRTVDMLNRTGPRGTLLWVAVDERDAALTPDASLGSVIRQMW